MLGCRGTKLEEEKKKNTQSAYVCVLTICVCFFLSSPSSLPSPRSPLPSVLAAVKQTSLEQSRGGVGKICMSGRRESKPNYCEREGRENKREKKEGRREG